MDELELLFWNGDMGGEEREEFVNLVMGEKNKYERFYLTFGSQYGKREPHPRGTHVHADGYVVITARDYDVARDLVVQLYGVRWSDLYTEEQFETARVHFPRGVLLNIQAPIVDEAAS